MHTFLDSTTLRTIKAMDKPLQQSGKLKNFIFWFVFFVSNKNFKKKDTRGNDINGRIVQKAKKEPKQKEVIWNSLTPFDYLKHVFILADE